MVSNDTPKSHTPLVDANDMDAAVNAAYEFDTSPLLVITLILIYHHDLHIYSRDCHI